MDGGARVLISVLGGPNPPLRCRCVPHVPDKGIQRTAQALQLQLVGPSDGAQMLKYPNSSVFRVAVFFPFVLSGILCSWFCLLLRT